MTDSTPLTNHGFSCPFQVSYLPFRPTSLLTSLFSILPTPVHAPVVSDDEEEDVHQAAPISTLTIQASLPAYGTRKGWKPTSPEHFGDGGAYPECHVAQYPLEMGRKKVQCNLYQLRAVADAMLRPLQETHSRSRSMERVMSGTTLSLTRATGKAG